ncbi:hypothetical protein DL546_009263 [Coniochaeta pulveracea]|uniref:Uncharacterized protein n=1 Tax=Coniochaeta pulveracea TaxID=177199 RepID=A0A420YNT4_9PEZI|nr:hypothetical protein DL546_009263 [Coniochaeta pulveracea]
MYLPALLATALGAVVVNAVVNDIGVPSTIKSGDTFNILGHQTIGQGYGDYVIVFGIQNGAPSSDTAAFGNIFAGPFNLATFGSSYNLTIPNVQAYADKGPAVIKAAIMSLAGVYRDLSVHTISVSTTIGDSTSSSYVYSQGSALIVGGLEARGAGATADGELMGHK